MIFSRNLYNLQSGWLENLILDSILQPNMGEEWGVGRAGELGRPNILSCWTSMTQ